MRELQIFIKNLRKQDFQIVSVGEVGEEVEFKNVSELIGAIQVK